MIKMRMKGDFSKTTGFFKRLLRMDYKSVLEKYGRAGVEALAQATPKDTGKTAQSWDYSIEYTNGHAKLSWYNSNVNNGTPIAILIQYGHGTGTGGYVQPIDYINPALEPIYEGLANELWEEVTR